jgi:pilus assembly protein Flp/PilA
LKMLARRAARQQSEEAGQGLAEYGLILALIAAVCIGGLTALGIGIRDSTGFVALPTAL